MGVPMIPERAQGPILHTHLPALFYGVQIDANRVSCAQG